MPAKNGNENPKEALHDSLIAAGYTVTIRGDEIIYSAPEMKQTAGRKTTAKTTPAQAKPETEAQKAWKLTLANKTAFKAMKGNELPATLNGTTGYTQKQAIAAGLLTPITRVPTVNATAAGELDATKGADVEGFIAPEGYTLVRNL